MAVTVCEPTDSDGTVNDAVPMLPNPDRATGPPELTPSMTNCTEPVGVEDPDVFVTVAVNVPGCPSTDGFCELLTTVDVDAVTTTVDVMPDPQPLFDGADALSPL